VKGFPTIKWFIPEKEQPVDYNTDRSLEGFNKYLRRQLGDDYIEPEGDIPVEDIQAGKF